MTLEWKICLKAAASAFLLYLCVQAWPSVASLLSTALSAAAPLFLGCVIAYLVNILMRFYEKHWFPNALGGFAVKSRRPVCLIAAFLTLIVAVILVVAGIVPELVSCVGVIFSALPAAIESIVDAMAGLRVLPAEAAEALNRVDWQSTLGRLLELLTTGAGTIVSSVVDGVSTVFSGVVTVLLALIFSIYLLLGRDTLVRQCKRLMERWLRPAWNRKITYVLSVLNDCFSRYIVGQCVEAVILGALCALGMWILRLPYAAMIGTLIGFTALIPVAGAYIGGAVGALMIFSVSPMKALIFLIFLVLLQQAEGNLIYPRVVGASLGLPAIWVLAAVTIGGGIMGIAGMMLGVPIAAALYRLLRNDLNKPSACANAPKTEG